MKVAAFKKLIKEAVRDAVREELMEILNSNKPLVRENLDFTSDDAMGYRQALGNKMVEQFGLPQQNVKGSLSTQGLKSQGPISAVDNPFAAFINDAGNNMSADEIIRMKQMS